MSQPKTSCQDKTQSTCNRFHGPPGQGHEAVGADAGDLADS